MGSWDGHCSRCSFSGWIRYKCIDCRADYCNDCREDHMDENEMCESCVEAAATVASVTVTSTSVACKND